MLITKGLDREQAPKSTRSESGQREVNLRSVLDDYEAYQRMSAAAAAMHYRAATVASNACSNALRSALFSVSPLPVPRSHFFKSLGTTTGTVGAEISS